jgi:predicted ATPase
VAQIIYTHSVFMIKKITIENFFSFGESQTIELNADTNVLVGINGTGKSNFIKAIRLLKAVFDGSFEKLFSQTWGGFSGAANFINPDASQIKISYVLDESDFPYLILLYGTTGTDLVFQLTIRNVGLSSFALTKAFVYDGKELVEEEKKHYTSSDRFEVRMVDCDDAMQTYVKDITIYDSFETYLGGSIRQLSPYYSDDKLLSNGYNLTALLSYLNGNSIKAFDKLIEEFKNINPNFRELVFTTPVAGKSLLSLKEKNLDRAISIEHISDGTLRYLLYLSIFYNPKRGRVICIDEPETGLHPDMINGIARGIKYAAQNGTQMIIATHSPLLLNDFELEDLMIFEKDNVNQSIVKTVSEEDYPNWEGEFLAGQMWLRGQIGGTRW